MTISPARMGLCSVTFRSLTPAEVLRAGNAASLALVEWGSDVHAPPDSPDLEDIATATTTAGMIASSYGTYWRAGASPIAELSELVGAARRLQTPRVRIWTAESPAVVSRRVVNDVRAMADEAGQFGIDVALEYHEGTVCDSAPRVLDLLDVVARPNVKAYWQPIFGASVDSQLGGLEQLIEEVAALHVFGLSPTGQIAALTTQRDLWDGALDLAHRATQQVDLLLEFVPGDEPRSLREQAAVLTDWVTDLCDAGVPIDVSSGKRPMGESNV